jgi:hypothetical protein
MPLQPHPWTADDAGDCINCVLPERHPVHVTVKAPAEPAQRPLLAPVDDAYIPVRLNAPSASHRAAAKALPRVGTTKRAIFAIIANKPHGATDDELEIILDKTHQSVSASRNSLMHDGWIEPLIVEGHHVTRKTRSGNEAYAWTLTAAARAQRTGLSA